MKLDLETKSPVDLKRCGVWRYAEQSTILLFAYWLNGARRVWSPADGEPMPEDLEYALADPDEELWAHKADFDRVIMLHSPDDRIASAARALERWRCSMARAYAHGLPGSLDKLGDVLGLKEDQKKMKRGVALMRLFCIPPAKNVKRGWATPETHPAEWTEFKEYAGRDIDAMDAVMLKTPAWNYKDAELALWHLDQRINARGLRVDMDLVHSAIAAAASSKSSLAARTQEMTDGDVQAATQRDKLLAHILAVYEVTLPDMRADTLERRLRDQNLPDPVRELIAIRLQASSASIAKYEALLRAVSSDGRVRGLLQFCGASRTGRWAGRLVQLQNMPRPTLKQPDIDLGIELLKLGCAHLVFRNVIELCASAVRGFIIPSPGKKLVVADLANIEGRVAAWAAGEAWKLQAFRDYDTIIPGEFDKKGEPARKGPDLYKVAVAAAFDMPIAEVDDFFRQIGKVMELMLQYGGGVSAFLTGAATYGIDLDQMAEKAWPSIPEDVIREARDFMVWLERGADGQKLLRIRKLEQAFNEGKMTEDELQAEVVKAQAQYEAGRRKARHGLAEKTFIVCDGLKRMWRRRHPRLVLLWKCLERAMRNAINNPGQTFTVQGGVEEGEPGIPGVPVLKFRRDGAWLRIRLPSGRALCYPSPRVSGDNKITYMGVNMYTHQWDRIGTYGGKVFENIVQAAARDQLAYPMPAAEEAGYAILTHSHDELITEAPDEPRYTADELGGLMCMRFDWNEGLPLAAAGYESKKRYRKG